MTTHAYTSSTSGRRLLALTSCPRCRRLLQQTSSHCLHCNALLDGGAGAAREDEEVEPCATLALTAKVVGLASLVLVPLAPIGVLLGAAGFAATRRAGDEEDRRNAAIGLCAAALGTLLAGAIYSQLP